MPLVVIDLCKYALPRPFGKPFLPFRFKKLADVMVGNESLAHENSPDASLGHSSKIIEMNKSIFLKNVLSAMLPLVLLIAMSCNGSDDDLSSPDNVSQTLTAGNGWKVSWYWDKDKDETNDFSGYVFHFRDNGDFESVGNGSTVTGTWRITSNDGSQRLVIASGSATKPLSDLDDDWFITSQSDN